MELVQNKEEPRERVNLIIAPEGCSYLNQFMKNLPCGILNKEKTGCGATSVVIENDEDSIICCPSRQLINNKVSQYPNSRCGYRLLGVDQNVRVKDIQKYIADCKGIQPVKIMVTYDSYPKVKNAIGDPSIQNYKIIVDEYQELLDAAIYRDKAVKNLLNELKGVRNVTFVSATPIAFAYRPDELKALKEYKIVWKDNVKIMPIPIETDSPISLVIRQIINHKNGLYLEFNGKKVLEYYFFVNSVNRIMRIIKGANLSQKEAKIVCANTSENKKTLGKYKINNVSDPNKPFTFCTKSVFYGADFYSDSGLAIIVSDGYTKSSMLDISSDIPQITGRIRNQDNPFKNLIVHIYNTGKMCLTKEKFENDLNKKIESAHKTIGAYNQLEPDYRSVIVEKINKTSKEDELAYYDEKNDSVYLDELKIAHLKYKFEVIDSVYKNGISINQAYENAGFNMDKSKEMVTKLKKAISYKSKGSKFEQLYNKYSNDINKTLIEMDNISKDNISQKELISLAYQLLGNNEVLKMKFNEDRIREEVGFLLPSTQKRFKDQLKVHFQINCRYTYPDWTCKLN